MTQPDTLARQLRSWAGEFATRGGSLGMGLDVIAFLLALRLDHEYIQSPYSRSPVAPEGRGWASLVGRSGDETVQAVRDAQQGLRDSATTLGMLSRFGALPDEPAHLTALITAIDRPGDVVGGPWSQSTHVLASAVDQVLVEAGSDGAIDLLPTHRELAGVLGALLAPTPADSIHDPAAGSGGLLLAARAAAASSTRNRSELTRLREGAFTAGELRPDTARWCVLNLLLHGIGTLGSEPVVQVGDSLAAPAIAVATVVLTNPEFGRQSASLMVNLTAGSRSDITVTGNRQIDMLQHVMSMLQPGGRAAVFLPDNVLFEGGAGAAVRKRLLDTCDLHTVLRLPTGISRKGGVKANVLFFDKKPAREEPWTTQTWFYDLRTNQHFTLKRNKMTATHLQPFVDAFQVDDRSQRAESERFKAFSYAELTGRDQVNLDITWLKDDSHVDADDLPDPDVLARELSEELYDAATLMEELADELEEASP